MRSTASSSSRRRVWLLSLALAFLVLMVAGVLLVLSLLSARSRLMAGERDLPAGLTLSAQGPARAGLQRDLAAAATEFQAARGDVALWSGVLGMLRVVPAVGPQLAAVSPASDAAYHATSGALDLVTGAGSLLSGADPGGHMPVLLSALQSGHARFVAAAQEAAAASRDLAAIPGPTGNSSLDRATAKLRRDVPSLRRLGTWLVLAPDLLGAGGPRHYLIAWQNSAELRATGGFIGAIDWVTLRNGSASYAFHDSSLPHEVTVTPPLPEALYTPERSLLLRDANWSPDFRLSARVERWLYGEDTGRWADGVVNVVDGGVAGVLQATGPVYLPAYGRWVTASNVQALAEYYRQSSAPAGGKRFIGVLLHTLVNRIGSLPRTQWPALGAALSRAIASRDILLYDRSASVEAAIGALHAAGRIAHPAGDYLAVVDDNRSYNKINPYVQETATYTLTVRPDLWGDADLALRYRVLPSPAGLEGMGPGYGLLGSKHAYEDFLRVYVPAGARLLSMHGVQAWAPQGAYGHTQFAGAFILGPGPAITVRIHYLIPPNAFPGSQYRLTVQRQPGTDLSRIVVTVRGGPGVGVSAPAQVSLPLAADAHLHLGLTGANGDPVALPADPSGDPYLQDAAFHDPRHPL